MSKKQLTIIATLLCLALLSVCVVLYVGEDRQGPRIYLEDTGVTYSQGDSTDVLLQGVTAVDDEDGDVTDTLRVVQMTDMSSLNYVVVTYVAKDLSNNVTKTDRWINLTDGSTSTAPSESLADELEEQSENALAQILAGTEAEETQAETEDVQTSAAPRDEEESESNESESESTRTTESSELVSTGAPVIRLTSNELHLELGESFEYMAYVQSCVDDQDTLDELYSRIVVNGQDANGNTVGAGIIDTNRVTSYDLNYYVFDTDGNMSNVESLHVTVGY